MGSLVLAETADMTNKSAAAIWPLDVEQWGGWNCPSMLDYNTAEMCTLPHKWLKWFRDYQPALSTASTASSFSWACSGTPSEEGIYLTINPLACPNTDTAYCHVPQNNLTTSFCSVNSKLQTKHFSSSNKEVYHDFVLNELYYQMYQDVKIILLNSKSLIYLPVFSHLLFL